MKSDLERLSDQYEQAEAAFLGAVRAEAARSELAVAARAVAAAATEFNTAAYEAFRAGAEDVWIPLDQLTQRTEVLAELWLDLSTAYEV